MAEKKQDNPESRGEQQKRDQERVKLGKGSGLDSLADEQEERMSHKKNNKLKSDEVKHH